MSELQWSKVMASVITVFIAFLLVMIGATATFLTGRYVAVQIIGMNDIEYLRDSVVASSSIVIHLTLDRFLHHAWRCTRCLRAAMSLLIAKFLSRK
jgi:hypothetical protein